MFTVCIMLLSLSSPLPRETRCVAADAAFLHRAQVTCSAAQKDPLATCEALRTSDGSMYLFVHRSL